MNKNQKQAFSLVELVITIAVISILMSLIVPISQNILINARKSKAQAAMTAIASAYMNIYQQKGYIPNITSGEKLAEFFASNNELNNANMFVFPGDGLAAKVKRESIFPTEIDTSAWTTDGEFSVCLIGNIVDEVNADTTPVAFSRGLQSDGSWSNASIYGNHGGFIAFLNGTVKWYNNLKSNNANLSGKLSQYNSNKSTSNIKEALPPSAVILARNTQYSL